MENKEIQDARLFIKRLALFASPIILILALPLYIFLISGEGTSADSVIKAQTVSKNMVLYGLGYSNPTLYYKLRSVVMRQPDVIALGSSRVMQFRSDLFLPGVNFFNAGGGVEKIKHLRMFLGRIPRGQEPKMIIVGLDQVFFNYNWDSMISDDAARRYSFYDKPEDIFLTRWFDIYKDFFVKRYYSIGELARSDGVERRIGLSAVIKNFGFRNDGSNRQGYVLPRGKMAADDFSKQLEQFNRNQAWFAAGSQVNREALNEIDIFLTEAEERGIYVVGFLPPYSAFIYKKMKADEKDFAYFFQIESALKPIFNKHQFAFYNFSSTADIDALDNEMLDIFHPSEKVVARLFIKMAEDNAVLKKIANLDYIKRRLRESKSQFEIFEH